MAVYPFRKYDQHLNLPNFPMKTAMIDSRAVPYATLVLRVALGVMFLAHGLMKLPVFTLPGTAQFFESVGFPVYLAYVVTFAEAGAGVRSA